MRYGSATVVPEACNRTKSGGAWRGELAGFVWAIAPSGGQHNGNATH